MTCRKWLSENGYEDVGILIDEAMAKMAGRGSKQRRNWWDILSGGIDGAPSVCEGIEFPVLRVAQRRQRKEITKNAISRNRHEQPPKVLKTGRWKKDANLNVRSSDKKSSPTKGYIELIRRHAS